MAEYPLIPRTSYDAHKATERRAVVRVAPDTYLRAPRPRWAANSMPIWLTYRRESLWAYNPDGSILLTLGSMPSPGTRARAACILPPFWDIALRGRSRWYVRYREGWKWPCGMAHSVQFRSSGVTLDGYMEMSYEELDDAVMGEA